MPLWRIQSVSWFWRNSGIPSVYVTRDTTLLPSSSSVMSWWNLSCRMFYSSFTFICYNYINVSADSRGEVCKGWTFQICAEGFYPGPGRRAGVRLAIIALLRLVILVWAPMVLSELPPIKILHSFCSAGPSWCPGVQNLEHCGGDWAAASPTLGPQPSSAQ